MPHWYQLSAKSRREEPNRDLTPQLLTFAPASHLSLTLPYKGREKEKLFLAGRGSRLKVPLKRRRGI